LYFLIFLGRNCLLKNMNLLVSAFLKQILSNDFGVHNVKKEPFNLNFYHSICKKRFLAPKLVNYLL